MIHLTGRDELALPEVGTAVKTLCDRELKFSGQVSMSADNLNRCHQCVAEYLALPQPPFNVVAFVEINLPTSSA